MHGAGHVVSPIIQRPLGTCKRVCAPPPGSTMVPTPRSEPLDTESPYSRQDPTRGTRVLRTPCHMELLSVTLSCMVLQQTTSTLFTKKTRPLQLFRVDLSPAKSLPATMSTWTLSSVPLLRKTVLAITRIFNQVLDGKSDQAVGSCSGLAHLLRANWSLHGPLFREDLRVLPCLPADGG